MFRLRRVSPEPTAGGAAATPAAGPRFALYKEIIRHWATYACGTLSWSVASALLLPFYTRYLSAAEYGLMAILDLTMSVVTTVVTASILPAITRWGSEARTPDDQRRVSGTAIIYVALTGGASLALGYLLSPTLAALTLGGSGHGRYYRILFPTLLVNVLGTVGATRHVAMKRSGLVTIMSMGRLVAAISLNIVLIAGLGWSVDGFLYSNLTVGGAFAAAMLVSLGRLTGFGFSRGLLRQMLSFSFPFVPAVLCATIMHEADRWVLQAYTTMAEVGVYSLGYKIAMTMNSLILAPFAQSWGPLIYEVRHRKDAPETYASVMRLFTYFCLVVMLALSVFAREIVQLLAGAEFHEAYRVIPLVAFGYVFFSMHDHLKIPVLVTGRTREIPIVYASGALFNVVINCLLVPRYGARGAAAATLGTFMLFAAFGFLRYRRFYPIPFPWAEIGRTMLVAIGCFAIGEAIPDHPLAVAVMAKAAVVLAFAGFAFLPELRQLAHARGTTLAAVGMRSGGEPA